MNKFLYFICLFSLTFSFNSYCESSTIDDGDKGSGKYGNLIDKVETAEKAYDAGSAIGTGIDAAKNIKKLKSYNPQQLVKDAKKEALEWANKYTASKGGFNTFMKNILKKVDNVITKVSDRVDMWRTTWPTLKGYAASVTRLADNTKQLFQDFKLSDLWDIDRKWDRRLESNIMSYGIMYKNISMFLNRNTDEQNKLFIYNCIVPRYNDDRFKMDPLCILAQNRMIDINPYRSVPHNTLEFCSATMYSLSDIESKNSSTVTSSSTLTKEEAVFDSIEAELENPNQSYEDSQELAAFIEQQRAKVRIQSLQVTQLQSAVELRYANLMKRDKQLQDEQSDYYQRSLKILCAGKSVYKQLEETNKSSSGI